MKRLIGVLILGGCLTMSSAMAAKSKAPKVHAGKAAKQQAKLLKKGQAKSRKEAKARAKTHSPKSA
jgi:hypothetical protein